MKKVWVGVEFGGEWEIVTCSALKDLAELCGFSYRGALSRKKGKGPDESFLMVADGMKTWMVKESKVKKVTGRGGNFKRSDSDNPYFTGATGKPKKN